MAHDWPHWRGPEQNGISREKNLISDWSPDGKNVVWKSDIGGRAAPVILDGRVYLNCRTHHDVVDEKEKIHAQEQVVCWDLKTGDVVWKDVFNVFQTDIPAPRVGWASMVADPETGNVYVHSVSGLFRCYDGKTGKVKWEYSLFEDYGKISGYGGRTQTPIIDEDRVIVSYLNYSWGEYKAPPPKHRYFAFDKKSGELQWIATPGGPPQDTNYSVPIVAVIGGVRMLIGGNADGGVYAMNARTGEKLWGFMMSKRGLNSSVVVDGNYVYASHGEDNIDTTEFGRVQCIDATGRGDITKTHSVWRADGIKAGYASLLVKDGILYVVSDNGKLNAFDSKKGDKLWEYPLGTVGKGSPVWADGKLYVMEVNGRVHILKPSREKCEKLSEVHLPARVGKGDDEIYASPAISNGRIVIVTRDRTFCLGNPEQKAEQDPIPPLPEEKKPTDKIAHLKLMPYEVAIKPGESVEYTLQAYDEFGHPIKKLKAKLAAADLGEGKVDGLKFTAPMTNSQLAGTVSAEAEGLKAHARIRVFPDLPWKWTFTGYEKMQVPPAWINAFIKMKPEKLDGEDVMKVSLSRGRPSIYMWTGPSNMKGYTVQADLMTTEERRQMSNVGVTVQRYNLVLMGNVQKLQVQSWAPHLRMAKDMSFRWDPDTWYTMKLKVDIQKGDNGEPQALVRGKVWKKGAAEPKEWTIEQVDPHPNLEGSPGLYFYAMTDCYVDNVIVSK